jgi:hypothetical protein
VSQYPDMGEVTGLRLELARERDRAEAFRHAFNVEVLKVMRASVIQATISADEEIARLKAEVERLRKAGDEMYAILERVEDNPYGPAPYGGDSMDAWNAAKDGKPTE